MPPMAKSTMYSATSRGVGISLVQCCVVATCQKASSSSGTISASTTGFSRRHSAAGRRTGVTAGATAGGALVSAIAIDLAVGDLVGELRIEEGLELRQRADLLQLEH